MRSFNLRRWSPLLLVLLLAGSSEGEEPAAEVAKDPANEARLKYMRDVMGKMKIKSTVAGDDRDLTFKMQPLLRYNDAARGIADSAIWRVGSQGRPLAIVSSELYGPNGDQYSINHEYLALDNPRITLESSGFRWKPPTGCLKFQEAKSDDKPADSPAFRMSQIKKLAARFTATEQLGKDKIVLRLLPTPIDRYVPSDKLNADGVIFAFVWGVNPEALLFIETDGTSWTYAFGRMGSAMIWAELDDVEVWKQPNSRDDQLPTALYAITSRVATIPPTFEVPAEKADAKP